MALGYTTYKTPNAIYTISEDLTSKEGCGVTLTAQGTVALAVTSTVNPYGLVTVGGPSEDGVTYPGLIGGSSVEFVDMVGCAVQALAGSFNITVGDAIVISESDTDGSFANAADQPPVQGSWVWGFALTNAKPGEQFVMRFLPQFVWYVAP